MMLLYTLCRKWFMFTVSSFILGYLLLTVLLQSGILRYPQIQLSRRGPMYLTKEEDVDHNFPKSISAIQRRQQTHSDPKHHHKSRQHEKRLAQQSFHSWRNQTKGTMKNHELVLPTRRKVLQNQREHSGFVDNIADKIKHDMNVIPHIFHQTWETTEVPGQLFDWMKTCHSHHHDWQYWFWTEVGARLMIKRNFSNYASMYMDYPFRINRADARRYFILYRYGGVYADLDIQCLHPLDELLSQYQCIIAQEPEEHRELLYANEHPNYVMPAFIACRPGHPFLRLVLQLLPHHAEKATTLPWNENIFRSTGPMFLADVLEQYMQHYNSSKDDYVHIAPPDWFMPTYDVMNQDRFRKQCQNRTSLVASQIKVCDKLKADDFQSFSTKHSYTIHHWIHSWASNFIPHGFGFVMDIIPDARIIDLE